MKHFTELYLHLYYYGVLRASGSRVPYVQCFLETCTYGYSVLLHLEYPRWCSAVNINQIPSYSVHNDLGREEAGSNIPAQIESEPFVGHEFRGKVQGRVYDGLWFIRSLLGFFHLDLLSPALYMLKGGAAVWT